MPLDRALYLTHRRVVFPFPHLQDTRCYSQIDRCLPSSPIHHPPPTPTFLLLLLSLFHHTSNHHPLDLFHSIRRLNFTKLWCTRGGDNSTSTDSSTSNNNKGSEFGNLLLKTAWYGSELLGIASSVFRSPDSSTSNNNKGSEFGNLLLKTAWYGSELLGIASSVFRSPEKVVERGIEISRDGDGVIDRSIVIETIKGDFQRNSLMELEFLPVALAFQAENVPDCREMVGFGLADDYFGGFGIF